MVKVQLPKVEEETRTELNIIKARRKDKSLDETLNYLIDSEKQHYSPENISIIVKAGTLDKLKNYDIDGNSSWDKLLNRMMDELDVCRKENDMLSEIRELIFGPINHIMKSTNEEIDKLELGNEFYSEFEQRVKRLWKRFSKTTLGDIWTGKELDK